MLILCAISLRTGVQKSSMRYWPGNHCHPAIKSESSAILSRPLRFFELARVLVRFRKPLGRLTR